MEGNLEQGLLVLMLLRLLLLLDSFDLLGKPVIFFLELLSGPEGTFSFDI